GVASGPAAGKAMSFVYFMGRNLLEGTSLSPTSCPGGMVHCHRSSTSTRSHVRVVRPAAALRRHPHDVLRRVLDVAGLAVHAVLRVDLQPLVAAVFLDELVHGRGAVAALRPGELV